MAGDAELVEALAIMQASLPRRGADELTAEIQVATYKRMLAGYPKKAVDYLVNTALRERQWFPTIKECLDILATWQRWDGWARKRHSIRTIVRSEQERRMADVMSKLRQREMPQDEIDALPERWKAIASERMYLWRHQDGTYTVRDEMPLRDQSPPKGADERGHRPATVSGY